MATSSAKPAHDITAPGVHGAPGIVVFARAETGVETLLETGACACAILDHGGLSAEDTSDLIVRYRAASMDVATALVSLGDINTAKMQDLDGVHLTDGTYSVRTARERLGRSANIGIGPADDRHGAMLLGEQEPDYVLLAGADKGRWTAPDSELVTWWAELFEVPSVAFGDDIETCVTLAAAGADFVALGTEFCGRPDAANGLRTLASQLADMTMARAAGS
ncbi:MAG: thiamine phosphate synthase [Pseudomonadota bacterium]